jgi:hypothetical protein
MSHNLSELLLALLARVWRGEPQSVRAVVGPSGKGVERWATICQSCCWPFWQGCGEVSHNLSELLLALLARVWRDEPQSVRAVVGPAGKGVER